MKTALLLYEASQVQSLALLVEQGTVDGQAPDILSLDAEIDFALAKRGVSFVSARDFQNKTTPAAYLGAGVLTRALCNNAVVSTFVYKGVSLMDPLRFSVHHYFAHVLYYIDLLARFADTTTGVKSIIVPAPTTPVSKTSGFLAEHAVYVVVEAARRVAESRGLQFKTVQSTPLPLRFSAKISKALFSVKRSLFGVGLLVLNMVVSARPRRAIRIVASDYWRNINPLFKDLPEAELILIDRTEALKAGWKDIWRHKIRFLHISDFLTWNSRRKALHYVQECKAKWKATRPTIWQNTDLTFGGVSLETLCERIMDRLVEVAFPRVACDIAGAYGMYKRLTPDAVLLRASVSEQLHFSILPLVARQVGIPSLEPQHGIEYLGPYSPTTHHAAEFIATYGPFVCSEYENVGYAKERVFAIGSPRFDTYAQLAAVDMPKDDKRPVSFLSTTPSISVGERHGTYSTGDYFTAIGDGIRKTTNAHLVVTSRSGSLRGGFFQGTLERALRDTSYESVGVLPMSTLFKTADVVICSFSTVAYEALQFGKPLILAAFAPVERLMMDLHFGPFEKAGALIIAHTPEEMADAIARLSSDSVLREQMSKAGRAFMKEHFSFDGQASVRLAQKIRSWARR